MHDGNCQHCGRTVCNCLFTEQDEQDQAFRALETKLRHALWAINSLRKLKISRTQKAIIDLALENIEKAR